jgi:hypothetical protein
MNLTVPVDKLRLNLHLNECRMDNERSVVPTSDLHRDLNIESVIDIIKKMAENHERRLHNHPNTEAIQLLNYNGDPTGPSPWNCVSARSDPS